MLTILLTVIHVVVCLMLILVILLQAGRGQGLTGPGFGSGNVQSLLGTRAADFLTKATTVSAIFFLFTCIGLNYIEAQKARSLFQAGAPQQQLDMDAIQKALEKVKSEQAAANPAAEGAAVADQAKAVTEAAALPQATTTTPTVPAANPPTDDKK